MSKLLFTKQRAKASSRETGIFSTLLPLLIFMATGCLGLMILFFLYVSALPSNPQPVPTPADGIVVLTGTAPERIETGLELLNQGLGKRLLISGVYDAQDIEHFKAAFPENRFIQCCVDLDYAAGTTVENAIETGKWARVHDYKSLILVTSAHHVPRALLEFRRIMPTIELTPIGVRPDRLKFDEWWMYPGSFRLLVGEFGRYTLSMINLSL